MKSKKIKITCIGISLIMCLSVVACSKTTKTNETASTTKGKPEVLEITKNMFFGDASDSPELKSEFAQLFEKKYGIKLKVNALPRNNYVEKVNLMVTSGEAKGILSLFGPPDVLKSIEDGTIEPLDDYLKDNKVWQSMPEEYKNLFKFDGKVWAFASRYNGSFFTRWYRQDWLDNLGLKAPNNVDELYEVAKAFTEKDPDKNGKKDTYGLTAAGTWNLQDIFQAFDARLDNTGSGSIAYDPNEDAWVDSMLKPGMIDALKYINKMYANGYLDPEVFTNKGSTMREKIYSGKAGSTFYWASQGYSIAEPEIKKTNPKGSIVEQLATSGKQTKNLNQMVMTGPPYVLLKGTKDPKEVVNTFINTFFGEESGYLMGKMGIEGKTYKKEGNNIIWLKEPSADPAKGVTMGLPAIVDEIPKFPADKYPTITDGTDEEKKSSLELLDKLSKMKKDGLDKKLVFICPGNYDVILSKTYTEKQADISRVFQEVTTQAIMGKISAEEAVANYIKSIKAYGGDKILEEANTSIGKTTKQKY